LRTLFTIPDPDLKQESSVDPLGLQVIWVNIGQDIFGEKLTTIANDLRIFTFNLIHNHIIYRLYQEYPEQINIVKTKFKSWQTDFDVKSGLIIFLEDLVTHAFYLKYQDADNARGLGILGVNKARQRYHNDPLHTITIEANKNKGLLTRQISLGMQGRYKGPMMNMDFFDRSLSYTPKTWNHAERFIYKWSDVVELENHILGLIKNDLFQSKNKDYPIINIQEIKSSKNWKSIQEKYIVSFGQKKLPAAIRNFWKDKMNLNSGAQSALLNTLQLKEVDAAKILYANAKSLLKNEPTEQEKINKILTVEPFLSHTEYLIRYLSQASIKRLAEETTEIEKLRVAIHQSAGFNTNYLAGRLKDMYPIFINDKSLQDWIAGIIQYHDKIMKLRGGNAWLDIDQKGLIKHHFSIPLSVNISKVDDYLKNQPWLHTYYYESLQLIASYLN
jgi:hypothetical protein